MGYKLFLDDERQPKRGEWVIVRNYLEFIKCIEENGLPELVSFDHDLGDTVLHKVTDENGTDYEAKEFNPPLQKTGFHCAKWLCEYCMDKNLPLPETNVHSANSVGAENIQSYLDSFRKTFKQ
jgi:hypothetical protein